MQEVLHVQGNTLEKERIYSILNRYAVIPS